MPQPLSQLQNLLMRFTTPEKWLHAGAGVEIFPGFGAEPMDSLLGHVVA